jgi:hypothetical protein
MKKILIPVLLMGFALAAGAEAQTSTDPGVLPGELTAEQILNGEYPCPLRM